MAANSFELHLTGLQNISDKILALPDKARTDVVRPAIRDGARVIKNAAVDNAKMLHHTEGTETHIYPNIVLQTYVDKRNGNIFGKVGVAGGARYRRGDREEGKPSYWRYVEFGTFNDDGSVRTRPQPFMRPAMNENVNNVLSSVVYELSRNFYRMG